MSDKPNVFIASSVEGLHVAEAVNIKLEYDAVVKQWDNDLSSVTITSLIKRATETDFGVFVFHKDDKTTIRENTYSVVRDNVLFELGLFIGALGIENCFVLVPKSSKDKFRLPTDLAGVTTTTYDDDLDDMIDAVATSCAKIKHAIKKGKTTALINNEQKNDSVTTKLQLQLSETQSELWWLKNDAERLREDFDHLLQSVRNHFFLVAKPATEAEITAWEKGAENTYLGKKQYKDILVFTL
jgi:hypothetical protein